MAWRQSPGGSEQHLTLAAAAARTRTQRPGKHLAVHASKLVVKPDLQILRRYRRPLLLRLEHAHRSALEDHVHRASRVGQRRLLNVRIGIRAARPNAEARSRSFNTRAIFLMISLRSVRATFHPVRPSTLISCDASFVDAIIGNPCRIASTKTRPNPSREPSIARAVARRQIASICASDTKPSTSILSAARDTP